MRIPLEMVLPDPDLMDNRRNGKVAERPDIVRPIKSRRPPVVVKDPAGRYVLVAGSRQFKAAREAGEADIECTVKEQLTEQEREELRLAEMYNSGAVPPMELGQAFMTYRDTYAITQQELARRTGITPGTIHHYESLHRTLDPELGRKVDNGELTFKEARSIADLLDHRRQREIAAPFLDGRLSSVHVERIVGRAKEAPEMSVEKLIEEVVAGSRPQTQETRPVTPLSQVLPLPAPSDSDSLETMVLRLAGHIDGLRLQTIPEYRRLKLISSLRILDSRLKSALAHLNGGLARDMDRPRPLAGV